MVPMVVLSPVSAVASPKPRPSLSTYLLTIAQALDRFLVTVGLDSDRRAQRISIDHSVLVARVFGRTKEPVGRSCCSLRTLQSRRKPPSCAVLPGASARMR